MKKILVLAVLVLGFATASAQVSFKPGIRGGVNFSHFTKGDKYTETYYDNNSGNYISIEQEDNFKSKTDFYLGFFGALKLSNFYTLQPEVDYSRQGATYEFRDSNNRLQKEDLDVSYLSVAIANKFTFNKFNFHVGPTIDFLVEDNFETDNEIDFAFFLGAGYNFTDNLGIEARIKKGIIPVVDYNNTHTNVVFSVGATYTFDVQQATK